MADTKLFRAAGLYRDRGLSILPCRLFFDEKGKCKKPPLIKEWLSLQKAQVSKLEFMKWKNLFRDEPGRGIGVITGSISDLVVMDIDSQEAMDELTRQGLLDGIRTVTVKTPGGWHYWFKFREGFGNNVKIDESSGLDIRAEGGYVIAPPSLYPDGRPYQYFEGGKFVDKSSVSVMPDKLYEHLQKLLIKKKRGRGGSGGSHGGSRDGSGRKAAGQWFHDLMNEGVERGSRTAKMVEMVGYLIGKKMPKELIESTISLFNRSLGEDSLTDHELREEVLSSIARIQGDIEQRVVKNLNRRLSLVELESGERVIAERFTDHRGLEKLRFAKIMQVRESYIEKEVLINKKPECIFDIWRYSREKRKHYGVIFDPSATPWEDNDFINLWKGIRLEPKKGDWSLFRNHIETIISIEHHEWIIQWMARIVQDPGGKRPGTVLVLRGDQGTGKGVFANTFGALLGKMEYYFSVNKIGDLTGRFNEDLKTALLLFIDEATWGGDKETAGVLKSLVTEPTRRVEPKGINAFHIDNFLNLIIASNNDWVVPGGANERRFLCLDIPNDRLQDHDYFEAIGKQMYGKGEDGEEFGGLRGMMYDLLRIEVDFKLISTIPKTAATGDQIARGLSDEQRFWYERLYKGTLVDRHDYWKYACASEKLYESYEAYCKERFHNSYHLIPQQFGTFLKKVCPKLERKKVRRPDNNSGFFYQRIFPSLEECRRVFDKQFGISTRWPESLESEEITNKDRLTDFPGPFYKEDF